MKDEPESSLQHFEKQNPLQQEIASFELAQRKAKLLASSSLLPETFRNNIPNVMLVMNLAHRLDLDPMMVAQGIYFVAGKPAWNSQFIGALVAHSSRFTAIRFSIKQLGKVKLRIGKEEITIDDVECRVITKDKTDGEIIEGPECTLSMAHKEGWYGRSGSKWQSMPLLMLRYRAIAFFARVHCPDILCGLPTDNEVQDITTQEKRGRPRLTSQVEVAPVPPPPEPEPEPADLPTDLKEAKDSMDEWLETHGDPEETKQEEKKA